MKNDYQVAVVISGGGMLSAYSAGVIADLRTYLNPDVVIAGSGGSAIAAFYASGKLTDEQEKRAWTQELATDQMISPRRLGNIFDTDYLIDVIRHRIPLDIDAIQHSNTILEISALSKRTGELHYFDASRNLFDVIQASHAVPFLARPISIHGELFGDSFLSSYVYGHIRRVLDFHRVDKVIVVNAISFSRWMLFVELAIAWLFASPRYYRALKRQMKNLRRDYRDFVTKDYHNNQVFFIEPSRPTGITSMTVDGNKLWRAFGIGKQDAHHLQKQIKNFLSNK